MSFEAERQVLEGWFNDHWANACPIRWENLAWQEPIDATWVAFFIRPGQGQQLDIRGEETLTRHDGLVIVQVFQKEKTGTATASRNADRVSDIFRRLRIRDDAAGTFQFREPYIQRVGEANGVYQINVTCPYRRDTLTAPAN
jgi:hypothetical protein